MHRYRRERADAAIAGAYSAQAAMRGDAIFGSDSADDELADGNPDDAIGEDV